MNIPRTNTATAPCARRLLPLALLAAIGLGSVVATRQAWADARIERSVLAMGTMLRIEVAAPERATALAASERAVAAIEAAEVRLSTWRNDSELAALNQAPAGTAVRLTPRLADDLSQARDCFAMTAGAFDPTLGALVDAWGLRHEGRWPSATMLQRARRDTGMAYLELDGRMAMRKRAGLRLEEGGFGKGAGLKDALAALAHDPQVSWALLDFGGQVAMLGTTPPGVPWTVEVADPRDRGHAVLTLRLGDPTPGLGAGKAAAPARASFATSGNSERAVVRAGRRIPHLLDPRSGRPATDFGSLTVWASDPLLADCLSTGLYVMGPDAALAWAAAHPGIEALALITEDGSLRARATPGLGSRIRLLADGIELETNGRAEGLPLHKAVPRRPHQTGTDLCPDRLQGEHTCHTPCEPFAVRSSSDGPQFFSPSPSRR